MTARQLDVATLVARGFDRATLTRSAAARGIGITQLARQLIAEGLRHDRRRILIEVEVDEEGEIRAARLPQAS